MAVATRQIPRTADEALIAQRDALRDALAWAVRHLSRVGGYMSPEDCEAFRDASALVVEHEPNAVVEQWLAAKERG